MWVQIKTAPNKMIAEMWKELFEGEGIPTRFLPDSDDLHGSEASAYKILIPKLKEHVIEEVLRKI